MIGVVNVMHKNILFILGGLAIGGVETYIVRLTKELRCIGCNVDVLILSNKLDSKLMTNISEHANVTVIENVPFLSASSWINALLPINKNVNRPVYDIIHVVDLLTLGFIFLNKDIIRFNALSIGIYHSLEISWWRKKDAYFRKKLIELYDLNVNLTLFPSDSIAKYAGDFVDVDVTKLDILPLGIELSKYSDCAPSRKSLKIVSVGRLVDFKVYNKHMIMQLSEIRKLGDFHYYIYGDGPERGVLQSLVAACGVFDYVHFMGHIEYDELPYVLNSSYCFVGSGTSIIEASAAGIPSIVGIESIKDSNTCGFFSDVVGYSYNEESATSKRITFFEIFEELVELTDVAYAELSSQHRAKAREFDLKVTALNFLKMTSKKPDFSFSFNRWRAIISFLVSIVRFGPKALKRRFDHNS